MKPVIPSLEILLCLAMLGAQIQNLFI